MRTWPQRPLSRHRQTWRAGMVATDLVPELPNPTVYDKSRCSAHTRSASNFGESSYRSGRQRGMGLSAFGLLGSGVQSAIDKSSKFKASSSTRSASAVSDDTAVGSIRQYSWTEPSGYGQIIPPRCGCDSVAYKLLRCYVSSRTSACCVFLLPAVLFRDVEPGAKRNGQDCGNGERRHTTGDIAR